MTTAEQPQPPTERRVPWPQLLLDDIFLLLLCGMVVPTFFYLIWGLVSLGGVPLFSR
ncbi:MAG TPA: hypothetical protein VFB73_04255 [Chloroflexota bacterium]|nr:hypothetical protein [Chloroflexota bacterium]